jgi:hypothetical protein
VRIDSSIKTDHRGIYISIRGNLFQKRGPGFWKFNSSLLGDEDYVRSMNTLLVEAENKFEDVQDAGLKWDIIKCEIRSFTVKHSKLKAKARRDREATLLAKLTELENEDDADKLKDSILLENIRMELNELSNIKTKGAMVRSRANWAENGEKSTKYFLGLEKRNYKTNCITKLKLADGTTKTKANSILKEA